VRTPKQDTSSRSPTPNRKAGSQDGASDVFISYSRTDHSFVERLARTLGDRGLKVWVDLEGLLAGEEFLPRILSAIEGADAIVFVLSPDSIASPYCLRELEHAALHSKRILPLLRRDVETPRVPPAAASKQWLFVRETDDLPRSMDALESAIRVDPTWVRAHSRLLQRATEWETHGRSRSLALRGAELAEGETWLAGARDKEPQPSPLHTEFIVASRQATTRFRGIVLGAVSTALIVAIGLAAIAMVQRSQKETQRKIAVSRQLSAQGVSTFEAAPKLGLLLAAEALRRAQDADAAEVTPAEAALHQLLTRVGGKPVSLDATPLAVEARGNWLLGIADQNAWLWRRTAAWNDLSGRGLERVWNASAVRDAALAPDGASMVVVDAQGAVQRFSLTGSSVVQPSTRFTSVPPVQGVEFVEGGLLALETGNGVVLVPSDRADAPPASSIQFKESSTNLTVGAAGHVAAGVEFMGSVLLWNAANNFSDPTTLQGAPTEGFATVLSRDERWLAVRDLENVLLWDLQSPGEPKVLRVFDDRVGHVAFSANGRWLAAGVGDFTNQMGGDESIVLWRMIDEGPGDRYQLSGHTVAVTDFAFTADGRWLVSGDREGRVLFWDLTTPDPSRQPRAPRAHEGEIRQVIPLEGGDLLTLGADGLRVWSPGQLFAQPRVLASGGATARDPAFAADGRWLSVIGSNGENTLRVWELGEGSTPVATYTLKGFREPVLAAAMCPAGGCVVTGTRDGEIQLWRLAAGKATETTLAKLPVAVQSLAFSRDGAMLAAGGGAIFKSKGSGFVRMWDMRDSSAPTLALQRDALATPVSIVAFERAGRWLAVATGDELEGDRGSVSIWPTASRPVPVEPVFNTSFKTSIASLAFAPDQRLAAGGQNGRVYVYSGDGWRNTQELVLHAESQGSHGVVTTTARIVDFSADGSWLAAGSYVGPVRLWRTSAANEPPIDLKTGAGNITTAKFDPSGRWLATDDGSGGLALWNMEGASPRLAPLGAGQPSLSGIVFDARGEHLAGVDNAGNVRLWELRSNVLLAIACRAAGRNLTVEEWSRFIGSEPYRSTCGDER
jgi:WD40 repeat protein